jgi:HEAT repeat protein
MNQEKEKKTDWLEFLEQSLKQGEDKDKIIALDFLSQQNSLTPETCRQLFPLVKNNILNPDTQIRYFARKARNQILDCYPEVEPEKQTVKSFSLKLKEGESLSPEQILLHKMRLGSRYVVFEAIDRLTESRDSSIARPLLDFLEEETDEYKISYLLKALGRLDDEQIPEVLVKYLDNEDPRIVANAIESLENFKISDYIGRLIEFCTSSDNRIRANAIKCIYDYEADLAEQHIAEMVHSNNIALQASAVYLLRTLRPSNLAELLEEIHHSRFASVRIKALDIQPPDEEESQQSKLRKKLDFEPPDPRRDFFLMEVFLLIGAITLLLSETRNKHLLSLAFLGIAVIILLMHEKARTSVQKMALSMGFVSSMAWGNTRLMVLPALMGLWLTWHGNQIDKEGYVKKAKPESLFAWFFALGAIIITQLIQNEMALVLSLAQKLAEAAREIPGPIKSIVNRHERFQIMIFVVVSLMTIIIMKFNSWFPAKDKKQKPMKRLVIALVVCLGIVLLINVAHVFGITLQIKANNLKSSLEIVRQMLPQG